MTDPNTERTRRVTASMLWSAWADALGFISELTDASGLQRRLKGTQLRHPVPWSRRIGGRSGAVMDLPAGCYSDDTQLRLATSRCISSTGFDVEAFAHVELPIWPAYALGGGRASKHAAANLSRRDVLWYANFYNGWHDAGGNGAAMRIQPHLWAAPHPAGLDRHILDVIVNTVVTHAHPRAAVGAVLHALALGLALYQGRAPVPGQWTRLIGDAEQAAQLMSASHPLSTVWLPSWEKTTGLSWEQSWADTIAEVRAAAEYARDFVSAVHASGPGENGQTTAHQAYHQLIATLGLDVAATRGSGTATSIAALALAAAYPEAPATAALLASAALGTDTDTIATMAAAIIAASGQAPDLPSPVQDEDYLRAEATRLAAVAAGQIVAPFPYPDLLTWQAPRSPLDAIGQADEQVALAGLGWLTPLSPGEPDAPGSHRWEWTRADFGPTFLIKRRTALRPLPKNCWPVRHPRNPSVAIPSAAAAPAAADVQQPLWEEPEGVQPPLWTQPGHQVMTPDVSLSTEIRQMLDWTMQRIDDDASIGRAVRGVSQTASPEEFGKFMHALQNRLQGTTATTHEPTARSNLLAFDPPELEHLVRKLLEAIGLHSWVTRSVRDDGVDAIATGTEHGDPFLILIKRHRNAVPSRVVEQALLTMRREGFAGGVIATTSWFGPAAYDLAAKSDSMLLIDGRALVTLLRLHLGLDTFVALPRIEFPG